MITEDKNQTIVLVDATAAELTQVERFLQTSKQDFDVYLYQGDYGDLEYLNDICKGTRPVLINSSSKVSIIPSGIRYQDDLMDHFEQIEQSLVDNNT
jgi:hypothetical protein